MRRLRRSLGLLWLALALSLAACEAGDGGGFDLRGATGGDVPGGGAVDGAGSADGAVHGGDTDRPPRCDGGECGCVPHCGGRDCGGDGCGGSCGACDAGEECELGVCVPDGAVPCEGARVTAAELDLLGDDACAATLFYDVDCVGEPDASFTFACGKTRCDFTEGICEAMQPCGAVRCWVVGDFALLFARPCPNDPDCFGTSDEPAFSCEIDGFCDTWCPNDATGTSIDPDCEGEGGPYCPGGENADQCE